MNREYDVFTRTFLAAGDLLLGWMVALPTWLALFFLALLTSLSILLLRKVATDQAMLGQVAADMRAIKTRIRKAKQSKNKNEVKRLRELSQKVNFKKLKAEGRPLLWAMIPVALLAAWAFERLAYEPPRAGQPIELRLFEPVTMAGDVVHVVAPAGWQADGSPLALLAVDAREPHLSSAAWRFVVPDGEPAVLRVRTGGGTIEHPIRANSTAATPLEAYRPGVEDTFTRLDLRERKLFGVVPGIPAIGIPAWMAGYLLFTIGLLIVTKRLLKLH